MKLGIDNPEKWLDSVSDSQLALWEAFDSIEPIGREWEQHAALMSMLDAVYAACINPHIPSDKKDHCHTPRQIKDFLPQGYTDESKRVPLRRQMARLAKVMGAKYGDDNK